MMKILRQYFGSRIPEPLDFCLSRWGQDPFTFGAYSIVPPGTNARDFDALGLNVGPLYFAGEATSLASQGTTHGAYLSGVKAAKQLLSNLSVQQQSSV